ncbi:MAG: ferritin family protein [Smithellaceae bacterium]|nr:ferritin family protein [Smithellaceae bacterium]
MKERLNALEVALANELREREFYLANASRTANPVGAAMFRKIADEETEHYERLKELHAVWTRQQLWPETLPLQVKGTAVKGMLQELLKKAAEMPPADSDDLAAIHKAADFEAKGESHYAKLRDGSGDEKEKAFFALLVSIEHEHYQSLKDTEEYFLDPVSWFRKQENTILDGA